MEPILFGASFLLNADIPLEEKKQMIMESNPDIFPIEFSKEDALFIIKIAETLVFVYILSPYNLFSEPPVV